MLPFSLEIKGRESARHPQTTGKRGTHGVDTFSGEQLFRLAHLSLLQQGVDLPHTRSIIIYSKRPILDIALDNVAAQPNLNTLAGEAFPLYRPLGVPLDIY